MTMIAIIIITLFCEFNNENVFFFVFNIYKRSKCKHKSILSLSIQYYGFKCLDLIQFTFNAWPACVELHLFSYTIFILFFYPAKYFVHDFFLFENLL